MKNIHIIATDKPSRLGLHQDNKLNLHDDVIALNPPHFRPQNIYITNDEEIKEGDWLFANEGANKIVEIKEGAYPYGSINKNGDKIFNSKHWKSKIILTTDQDLINDGVQAIDDEFLEWFIKNPSCENLKVEENKHLICNHCDSLYSSFSDSIHCDVCVRMSKPIVKVLGYKIIIPKEEPKQETLEEAAEKLTKDFPHYSVRESMDDSEIKGWFLEALQKGAKWQAERMYSEEEVNLMFDTLKENSIGNVATITNVNLFISSWKRQFKKK